jgi:hypothetical protein
MLAPFSLGAWIAAVRGGDDSFYKIPPGLSTTIFLWWKKKWNFFGKSGDIPKTTHYKGIMEHRERGAKMRKKHRKEMMLKVTRYVSERINYLCDHEEYLLQEISDRTGISLNRLSEIKNHEKYGWPINEKYLAYLVGGGIVTIEDVLKNVDLTPEEQREIEEMDWFDLAKAVKQRGHDLKGILFKLTKVDPEDTQGK